MGLQGVVWLEWSSRRHTTCLWFSLLIPDRQLHTSETSCDGASIIRSIMAGCGHDRIRSAWYPTSAAETIASALVKRSLTGRFRV